MSTTRIMPIHKNKSKSVFKTISDTTNYAMNPDKTDNGEFISSFACNPETADAEFALSKREYYAKTGRVIKNDIVAYQLRQSFKPGEISPEEANELSYELASRLLKGKHAFIVATHVDKHHIHSHIIFNSTTLDCTHKYQNPIKSYRDIRRLADIICKEHQFSVIENPGPASPTYNEWEGYKKKLSNRDVLKAIIDEIISDEKPKSFDDFLKCLENRGYETKQGNYISAKAFNQKKFIRLKSLGDNYTEDSIKMIIAGTKKKSFYDRERPSMLIDIQKAMAEGKGIGYQNWAKSFNLKQMAKSFAYLQENDLLSFDEFSATVSNEKTRIDNLEKSIKEYESRLDEISNLKKHIINYSKQNPVYEEYKKLGKTQKYKDAHKKELEEYMDAKRYFDSLNLETKLPTVKQLNEEFNEILGKKNEAYNELLPLKKEYRKHLIYQENVRVLLDIDKNQMNKSHGEKGEAAR